MFQYEIETAGIPYATSLLSSVKPVQRNQLMEPQTQVFVLLLDIQLTTSSRLKSEAALWLSLRPFTGRFSYAFQSMATISNLKTL